MKVMQLADFHAALRAQGVPSREHAAVVCPICGTVQSIAAFVATGKIDDADAERHVGFNCIGRLTGQGGWPNDKAKQALRAQQGCDWSLGGLLKLHQLEVEMPDGQRHPAFVPASPEQARALVRTLGAMPAVEPAGDPAEAATA